MPLLPGKKNIGHNIEVEQEHGKPHKQAVAIALSNARKTGDREKDKRRCGLCGKPINSSNGGVYCASCSRRLEKGESAGEIMRKAKDNLAPVGAEDPERAIALKHHEEGITKSQDKKSRDVMPVGDALFSNIAEARKAGVDIKKNEHDEYEVKLRAWGWSHPAVHYTDDLQDALGTGWHMLNHGKAKDTELPTAIKTSNLVPMPSGEENEVSYAPRRAKDRGRFVKAGDAATLPIQTHGSEPKDHMLRAQQYEIAGDRARALGSYRAAASGYRKTNDTANESKARDGIEACQAKFAQQYDHPGKGRVKVCDSANMALRTAIERTRAGERVRVADGKKVEPAKARDEHVGFKKLEGELAHEKGVHNPAAVAASIGREKYGKEGMAKKAAAGRAKDTDWYDERIKELEQEVDRCKREGEPYADELRDIAEYKKEKAERARAEARARGRDKEVKPV